MIKRVLSTAIIAVTAMAAMAQSGTNSPYSQFGLGVLSDQTSGFNRGMGGLGIGFRDQKQVNFINPASYSSVDSLTFIFDIGASGQITNFDENGKRLNATNANFEYVVASFRAFRHVGVSFGVLPFTNVGYSYSSSGYLNSDYTSSYVNSYNGTGGIRQLYVGVGWEPIKNLSVGTNISYIWGGYDKYVTNSYSNSWINTLTKTYTVSVNSYKLDFGMQYSLPIGKKDVVTLGATFSPAHNLGANPECMVISNNTSTGVRDTAAYKVKDAIELPMMVGAGIAWNHNNQIKIGADYSLQKWGSTSFPDYMVENKVAQYGLNGDYFKDRHKVTFGGEYCNGEMSRSFLKRVRYRAGVSYATPYLKINGNDGPKELAVSAGFGIPIKNAWNNRSILNISGQWARQSGKGMITENTFRINIGMTFNERWFMKWKVE